MNCWRPRWREWAGTLRSTALLLLSLASLPAFADAQLRMLYRDKPPYSYLENGETRGFLFERTRKILDLAGVRASYEMVPPKRLFAEIEANLGPVCSFGWYRIPSREAFAKFTRPIHQDRPHLVLARRAVAERLRGSGTLEMVFRDKGLAIAAADGVSYGPELDALIGRFAGRVERMLTAPLQVAQNVAAGRADFMFIDQDDFDYLRANEAEFPRLALQALSFPDMPAGLRRHILCSRKVSDELMERMDAAIMRVLP
jgi:hypothetical protein